MSSTKKDAPIYTPQTQSEHDLAYAIAVAVKDVRRERGLNQTQLAELAGTKQPRISVVESAHGVPGFRLLLRLAAAMDTRLVIRFEKQEKQ